MRLGQVFRGILISASALAACCAQTAKADTEPVAHWRFEPSDVTADSSGKGNALAATNAVFRTDDLPPGTDSNGCLYLTGNGFLKTISALNLQPYSKKNLRVSFWMKNKNAVTSSGAAICELGPSFNCDQGAFLVMANGLGSTGVPGRSGAVGLMLEEDQQFIHVNYDTLDNASGEWEHFRIEFRPAASAADAVQVWRNGQLIPDANPAPWGRHYSRESNSTVGQPMQHLADETLYVGGRAGNKFPFFGLIDNLRIIDPSTHTLIAQWEFNGQGGDFLTDSSGNGYHLVHAGDSQGVIHCESGAPDGTSCAYFDGTGYLQTVKSLDLSAYERVKIAYSMYNYSPVGSPPGILLEQGENADNQAGFLVTVNELDSDNGRIGQVGVKFPGIVRDQMPHSAMRWWDWETDVWEDYEIEFDVSAENYKDSVIVSHNGELLADTLFSVGDVDTEGDKLMVAASEVGYDPWDWPNGLNLFIGSRNGSTMFFEGFLDEITIEAFDDGDQPTAVPEPSFAVLWAALIGFLFFSASFPRLRLCRCTVLPFAAAVLAYSASAHSAPLQISFFKTDVTPPLGTPLCDALCQPAKQIVDRLSASGIVVFSNQAPIVICSFDWVGIGNDGYDQFRETLAAAAGTTPERVALHAVHQHDTPGCDFDTERILAEAGIPGAEFNPNFARVAINRTAEALAESLADKQTVTHIGLGTGIVEQVSSNRRILGPDGKVERSRMSSCTDPIAIAAPEGTIDPKVQLISFWNDNQPLVSMTHYACHPQSYYNQGGVSYDFVGMARESRADALPEVAHVHFNGAGGNVAAGKYNTGAPANRPILAARLAEGMEEAWNNQELIAIDGGDVHWSYAPVVLPPNASLNETTLLAQVYNVSLSERDRVAAARNLVFLRRMEAEKAININCLSLGPAAMMYMPGELFVEYQLAAQELASDRFVAMAAYGDYGPGYIGTEISYWQGGYETGSASRVTSASEAILMQAMETLLCGPLRAGDADGNGIVNAADAAVLAENWLQKVPNWTYGDFNSDGFVNEADAAIMAANWGTALTGQTNTAPEPSINLMLTIMVVINLFRKRDLGRAK